MKNEIVIKLNRHLASGIEREADVVYVLAEIRKLFEHLRSARKYPVLAFYTNWALHTKIDREPWARAGLKMLEEVVTEFRSGFGPSEQIVKAVDDVLSFQKLRRELLTFGAEQDIRFDKLSYAQWREFATLLIDVLIDCPLKSEAATAVVKTLALSRDFIFSHAGEQTLAFWKIDMGNGKVMTGPIS
jgi:hypothetical protein